MRFAFIRDCVQAEDLRAASNGFYPFGLIRGGITYKSKEYLTRSQNTPDKISHLQPSKIRYLHRGPLRAGVASPHPKNNQKNPYILTGAAGAATGFA